MYSLFGRGKGKRRFMWAKLRSFKQECLNPANVRKLLDGLADYAKGTPVVYFVRHPAQRGKTNEKQIGEIEIFLIQSASIRNPDLQNIHGRKRRSGRFAAWFAVVRENQLAQNQHSSA